jgi:hypothetical protein
MFPRLRCVPSLYASHHIHLNDEALSPLLPLFLDLSLPSHRFLFTVDRASDVRFLLWQSLLNL